jgi:hypothetical protein
MRGVFHPRWWRWSSSEPIEITRRRCGRLGFAEAGSGERGVWEGVCVESGLGWFDRPRPDLVGPVRRWAGLAFGPRPGF